MTTVTPSTTGKIMSARDAGLVGCIRCGRVHKPEVPVCTRCGAKLASRDPNGLQRVWAWWLAGLLVYIPANLYPMLLTKTLTSRTESTILGGVVDLVHHGDVGIALIVFGASIVIPSGKFLAIAFLAMSLEKRHLMREHAQHRLFAVVEFIGRWSMIDVFVVAILASLVRFDAVATINPGIAAVSFALSVAFTMQAALSFDPRTIWDD